MGQSPASDSYNQDGEGLPFYQGNADFGRESPTPRIWCTDPKKIAEKGDILISVRAPIGAVNTASERCCIGRGVAAIRPNQQLLTTSFLKHQLLASSKKLEAMGTGSTFKAVGKKALTSFPISLYPTIAQAVIEQQLDWTLNELEVAKRQLTSLDSLVKSRFVEMFASFDGWEKLPLCNCVDCVESGKSPKCLATPRAESEPAVLKLSAISSGTYCEDQNKALPLDGEPVISKFVRDGDILLARKNTPELVGRSVLVRHTDGGIMFPDIVFRMHPLPIIDGAYLSHLLSETMLNSIRSLAHGSAKSMSNIPKAELEKLLIPIPPASLQRQFASFVAQVDKSRFVVLNEKISRIQLISRRIAHRFSR